MNLDLLISLQELFLTSKHFYYQSIEHSNADTSQQAQLPSNDLLAESPILEEEPGVETSPPPKNLEVTSPNQHPELHVEGLEEEQSKGDDDRIIAEDSSFDDQEKQYIIVASEHNVVSGNMSKLGMTSSKDATPTANTQTPNTTISLEELEQLERDNPPDAFDLLVKSDTLLSKSIGKSLDTSTGSLSETSKENLLAEFRSKVLEVDLLQALELVKLDKDCET